jgi:starch phosphorylase
MAEITIDKPVAYFCAEYGLQAELPLYAGGLGVLAGDTVKEAADQNFPMVAVGLLYRGGKATQKLTPDGMQVEEDLKVDPVELGFEHVFVPYEDQPLFIRVHLTKEDVWARVWKRSVNNTTLYLLDTDTDQNDPDERGICQAIYFGSDENILKQQMVLGIGGVKMLDALNIHPSVYHINEGRPAFLYWQLIRQLMEKGGLGFADALSRAKTMIVYTNHTLVRAGNQSYNTQLLQNYSLYYANKMGVKIEELLKPGIDSSTGSFSMTQFALNISRKASAVSQPHFESSKSLWPEFNWVGITNGVHLPTWQDPEIKNTRNDVKQLWETHRKKKRELMEYVLKRSGFGYDPERLVISWARRIAGYKRLNTVFDDIKNLARVVNNSRFPIQLLVSGKAHAADPVAKQILQQVIRNMQNELAGHAIYIPDYNIEVAQQLVKGSDVWLNTPIQGQEASGTSGMKAISNGVLQLTIEDGWTAEVDWHDIGWTLDSNHLSETLVFRLEQDVVPTFFRRDTDGLPMDWIRKMQQTIALSDQYSTTRMLKDYKEKLYLS